MQMKSYEEMNPEQQFAYRMGFYDGSRTPTVVPAEVDSARVQEVESSSGFLDHPDIAYTPFHAGEPGRYLIVGPVAPKSRESVWILGRWAETWEVMGAFDTREDALAAAGDGEFVARIPMGRAPEETVTFPDAAFVDKET